MREITLREIASACLGTLCADGNIKINSIVTDSRKVINGSLFAAIKGERVDGHDYIDKCIKNGAVCALCEQKPDKNIPYILVPSTLDALKKIAAYYRSLFNIPFIGVTGSVGKTSTKEMLSAVLSQRFDVLKTQGNFNNELGVPLTIFSLENHHEIAVIEMGISDFSEMSRLSQIVRPDVSVITNIGYCHLEKLIDRDGVLRAKTEMFSYLNDNAKVFLCGDDDKLKTVQSANGVKPTFFGLDKNQNDCYAENIVDTATNEISCTLKVGEYTIDVTIPAMGRHMVTNALCAAAVGKSFGLTAAEIKRGIESYKTVGSRSNIVKTDRLTIIDDCYNANPTSLKASLDVLTRFDSRKVAVLGDMKELGKDSAQLHTLVGEYAEKNGVDLLIAVGEMSTNTAKACKNSLWFETVEECINNLEKIINKDDTVLVKASHSMHFEKIVEALKAL